MRGETSSQWCLSLLFPPQNETQRRLELSKPEAEPGTLTQDMISRQTTGDTGFYLSPPPQSSCHVDVVAQAMAGFRLHTGVRRTENKAQPGRLT